MVRVCCAQEYRRMIATSLHKYYRDTADSIESCYIVSGLGMEILYSDRESFARFGTYLAVMLAIRQRSGDVVRIGDV